jgi:hypothetical protein
MAPRKRFNPIDFYRKAASAKPLSVAAPKTRRTPATTAQLSTVGHLFDKAAPLIADYITAEREKKRSAAERAEMQDMISALTRPGGEQAYDVVMDAPMDVDETSYDVDRDAEIAFNKPGGMSAVRAGAAPKTLKAQEMLLALTHDEYRQRQIREAAELKRSRGMEDYEKKKSIEARYREQKIDKYGTPFVVADKNSSTGYSRVQINQAGAKRILGEVAPPTKVFDPEAEQKKSLFGGREKRYDVSMAKLNEADEIIGNVNQMWNLVQNVDSGSLAEWTLEFKKFSNNFGFTFDRTDIANAEAMRSKGMDFILQRIQKTKGAISEKEMTAFKQASASLANTKEGNEMILNLSRSVAERMKAEAEAVREAYSKNPNMGRKELDDAMLKARKIYGPLWTPPMKPPKGFDPKVWYNMTKEQRVKYTRLGGVQ